MSSHAAAREAFNTVAETCPHVDRAAAAFTADAARAISDHLDDFVDEVKTQTNALREALVNAIEEKLEALARVSELEAEVARLESELGAAQ